MEDPYRIKIENGLISINIFERGKPIPHTSFKGKIGTAKTNEFISAVINKFSDKNVVDFLSFFIKNSDYYKNKMTSDFDLLSKEFRK